MGSIVGAYIEITGICNERCPYCYNEKLVNTGESLLFEKLTDLLEQLKGHGITGVAFSGGEPFLYERLHDVMEYSKKIGTGLTIISNGICFEENNLSMLLEFQPGLQITFDGFNSETHDKTRGVGNFEKITNGIKIARRAGYVGDIGVRVNLHKGNIGRIKDFLKMFESMFTVDGEAREIGTISMSLLHKTDSGGSMFEDYLDAEEYMQYPEIFDLFTSWNNRHTAQINYDFSNPDIGCPYNAAAENVKCGLRIALDGNVFPCQLFLDDKFSLGNVYNKTLNEIMNGEKLKSFIEAIHARKGNIEKCKSCGYMPICTGGCPATAYIENGTLNSVSSRCGSRKTHFNTQLLQILRTAQGSK